MIAEPVGSMAEALPSSCDWHSVLIGGFGRVGQTNNSIDGLIEYGAEDPVCVGNNAGNGHSGSPDSWSWGFRGEEMRQYFEVTRTCQEGSSEILSRSQRPASKTARTR